MARCTTKFRFVNSGMVWGFLVLVHHHRHTSPQEEQATRSKQQWRKGSKSGGSDSKHTQQVPSRLCSFATHWPRKTTSSCLGMRGGKTKDPGRNGIIMYSPANSPTVSKLTSLFILWFKCFLPNRWIKWIQHGSNFWSPEFGHMRDYSKFLGSLFRSIFSNGWNSQRPNIHKGHGSAAVAECLTFLKYSSRLHSKETGTSCILNYMFISIYLKIISISISHPKSHTMDRSPFLTRIRGCFAGGRRGLWSHRLSNQVSWDEALRKLGLSLTKGQQQQDAFVHVGF